MRDPMPIPDRRLKSRPVASSSAVLSKSCCLGNRTAVLNAEALKKRTCEKPKPLERGRKSLETSAALISDNRWTWRIALFVSTGMPTGRVQSCDVIIRGAVRER